MKTYPKLPYLEGADALDKHVTDWVNKFSEYDGLATAHRLMEEGVDVCRLTTYAQCYEFVDKFKPEIEQTIEDSSEIYGDYRSLYWHPDGEHCIPFSFDNWYQYIATFCFEQRLYNIITCFEEMEYDA